MGTEFDGIGLVWPAVSERIERHAPAGMVARLALERALRTGWVNKVFEAHKRALVTPL